MSGLSMMPIADGDSLSRVKPRAAAHQVQLSLHSTQCQTRRACEFRIGVAFEFAAHDLPERLTGEQAIEATNSFWT